MCRFIRNLKGRLNEKGQHRGAVHNNEEQRKILMNNANNLRDTSLRDALKLPFLRELQIQETTATAEARIANLLAELKSAQAERMFAAAEVSRIATERNEARRDARYQEQQLELALEREKQLARELEQATELQRRMEHSLSWRLTAPLRAFSLKLRSKRK